MKTERWPAERFGLNRPQRRQTGKARSGQNQIFAGPGAVLAEGQRKVLATLFKVIYVKFADMSSSLLLNSSMFSGALTIILKCGG